MENKSKAKQIDPAVDVKITAAQFLKWLETLENVDVVDFPTESWTSSDTPAGCVPHTIGINPFNMIRAIKSIEPFRKIEIRINGVSRRAGVVRFDQAIQRVELRLIEIDRTDWSRVNNTTVFVGRFDLTIEFRALIDIVELISRK